MATGIDALFEGVSLAEDDLYESREERKYVVDAETAAALRRGVAARLRLEQFVPGRLRTRVHSIYFDSADFSLYRENLAQDAGLKFRLRGYATAGSSGVDAGAYFECKLGVVKDGIKRKKKLRFEVPHGMAAQLFDQRVARRAATGMLSLAPKPKFWRKALFFLEERGLWPVLTVSYEREAYVSEDGRLRVTFDEGFCASRIHGDHASRLGEPRATLPGVVIVEVKFVGAFPAWVAELLTAEGLPAEGVAFSKFKTAVPMLYPLISPLPGGGEGTTIIRAFPGA